MPHPLGKQKFGSLLFDSPKIGVFWQDLNRPKPSKHNFLDHKSLPPSNEKFVCNIVNTTDQQHQSDTNSSRMQEDASSAWQPTAFDGQHFSDAHAWQYQPWHHKYKAVWEA